MAREEHRDAGRGGLREQLGHRFDTDRVQPAEGLVEDGQLGVVHQRRGQLDPLLVPVRQLLEPRAGSVAEAQAAEPFRGCLFRRCCVHLRELGQVSQLLTDLHLRVETPFLRHVAEAGSLLGSDGPSPPAHLASIGTHQAEDRPHGGGLARPVRTEEADDPTRRHAERRPIEGHHVPVPLGQIADLEHCCPPGLSFMLPSVGRSQRRRTSLACRALRPTRPVPSSDALSSPVRHGPRAMCGRRPWRGRTPALAEDAAFEGSEGLRLARHVPEGVPARAGEEYGNRRNPKAPAASGVKVQLFGFGVKTNGTPP